MHIIPLFLAFCNMNPIDFWQNCGIDIFLSCDNNINKISQCDNEFHIVKLKMSEKK